MTFFKTITALIASSHRLQIEHSWLLFFQLFLVGMIVMVLFLPIKNRLQLKVQNLELGLGLAAAILILNYLGFVVIYLGAPLFADPAEANVASVSWLFQTGHSLYPSSDAAARYINNYGSCLYIIQGAFLAVLKPSFFSVKLAGCLAGIVSLFVSFLLFKKRLPFSFAIAGCALTSLYFLALTSATGLVTSSFWVRPDSLLLLCTTIGIFLAAYGNKWSAVFGSAIAFGISTNLKITALLHFLPVYVLVFQRFGIIYTLISLIGSALVAIAPFFLFSNISLSNYLAWLQQVGRKGINPEQVIKNGLWLGFVSLPTAIAALHLLGIHSQGFKQWLRQYWLYFLLFVPCAGVAAIVGATRGALENNMLPFVPLLLYPLSDLMKKVLGACSSKNKQWLGISTSISITTALAFMLSTSLTVYSTEAPLVSRLLNPSSKRIVYDIEQVVKAHRDISMGYGSSYPLSTYRPAFVFAGNPYLLDSASLMEMQASGLNNTPDNTLNAIKTCQIPSWLIPKNEKPFEVYNYYPPLQKLFSDEFRQIFKQHYTQQAQTEFYDIWVCK